jgi:hypothetical protein
VHILDYKPDARTNKPITQLAIYALALTVRFPSLKLFDIKRAWFNEKNTMSSFRAHCSPSAKTLPSRQVATCRDRRRQVATEHDKTRRRDISPSSALHGETASWIPKKPPFRLGIFPPKR